MFIFRVLRFFIQNLRSLGIDWAIPENKCTGVVGDRNRNRNQGGWVVSRVWNRIRIGGGWVICDMPESESESGWVGGVLTECYIDISLYTQHLILCKTLK